MTTARPNLLRDVSPAVWVAVALIVVAVAITLHAVLPRYEFQMIENGRAMMIYDRWGGKFQRVNYDANGEPALTKVLTPF
jgi:hypothetical protein